MKNSKTALNFWENKIINWEKSRYSNWLILYPLSWTIRLRMRKATAVIKAFPMAKYSVVELGCGSGYLAERIADHVANYVGIDIAHVAIESAKIRIKKNNISFRAQDVADVDLLECDLIVFLGLTDWLESPELKKLFLKFKAQNLLFTYTESRVVSRLNPYRYYRLLIDRKSQIDSYKARSYSEHEIRKLLDDCGYSFNLINKASLLDPGAMVLAKKK